MRLSLVCVLFDPAIKKPKNFQCDQPKTLLLSLFQCLYNYMIQDQSLCQFVTQQLRNELDLGDTSVTPVDSIAIGYFFSSVSVTTVA